MKYCLDTNHFIYYLKGTYPNIVTRLREQVPANIWVAEMVRAELLYGALKSHQSKQNLERIHRLLAPFDYLPFSGSAVEHYADIRVALEIQGIPIGPHDLIIAATARANDAILVTHNTREFGRVPGLRLEDWTE